MSVKSKHSWKPISENICTCNNNCGWVREETFDENSGYRVYFYYLQKLKLRRSPDCVPKIIIREKKYVQVSINF